MRYQPDHKERTRQQIIETAGRLFRKNGVVATGVVPLMKEVGLTQGGFYAHFASKEELVREATSAAIGQIVSSLRAVGDEAGVGSTGLKAILEAYLSERHLEHPEAGCSVAAIGAELARESADTRVCLMAKTREMISLIEERLPDSVANKRNTAEAIFALISGNLQLARLTPDRNEAVRLLQSGRIAALALAGVAT